MKRLLLFFILPFTVGCTNSDQPVADPRQKSRDSSLVVKSPIDFKYEKAVAFVTLSPIFNKRRWPDRESISDSVSIVLTPAQIQSLHEILITQHPEEAAEQPQADCFNPRHHVYFLDEADKLIHYIAVCFECGNYRTSLKTNANMEDYATFFDAIGFPNYFEFSKHLEHYKPLVKKNEHADTVHN